MTTQTNTATCPCGSNKSYADCCGLYLDDNVIAPTAETLMRSRYTAYTLLRENYVLSTWHSSTRPAQLGLTEDASSKWLGLDVKRLEQQDVDHAIVEFVAKYKTNGRAFRLHETSRFVREDGCWFYIDGALGRRPIVRNFA